MTRIALAACAVILAVTTPARADWTGKVSMARIVDGKPAGGPALTGRMMIKQGRMRMEMTTPVAMTMISDLAKKKLWNVNDEAKSYTEADLDKANGGQRFPSCGTGDIGQCLAEQGFKKTGAAEANGFKCETWEIDRENNGHKQHQTIYRPIGKKDLTFVRMTNAGGNGELAQLDVTELKEGKLDEALFEPPKGYTKAEAHPMFAPGGGPGGRPGMPTKEQIEELMKKHGAQPPK